MSSGGEHSLALRKALTVTLPISVAQPGDQASREDVPHHYQVSRGPARSLLQPGQRRDAAAGPAVPTQRQCDARQLRRQLAEGVDAGDRREHRGHSQT